uniref:Uncharacterized protein n=1 Tax=Ascaris lumbricoides TaxID=6252 RepID=A0A0M3I569_ASCLU
MESVMVLSYGESLDRLLGARRRSICSVPIAIYAWMDGYVGHCAGTIDARIPEDDATQLNIASETSSSEATRCPTMCTPVASIFCMFCLTHTSPNSKVIAR